MKTRYRFTSTTIHTTSLQLILPKKNTKIASSTTKDAMSGVNCHIWSRLRIVFISKSKRRSKSDLHSDSFDTPKSRAGEEHQQQPAIADDDDDHDHDYDCNNDDENDDVPIYEDLFK